MPYALPQEKAVTLFVNGQKAVTLMASPEKLRALAIGFLYNAGMIREVSQIETLYACEEDARLMIEGNGIDYTPDTFVPLIASGCGAASRALPADLPKNTSRVQFSMQKIRSGFLRMLRDNTLYQKTGGMHTAALLSGSYFALAEYIGRHNAHDKVTGEALQAGVLLPEAAILSTGRISSDMVVKAIYARVPVLASLSIPTDLALQFAQEYGITLIGRAMKEDYTVYSHRERIR